jgi:hypothetical protein
MFDWGQTRESTIAVAIAFAVAATQPYGFNDRNLALWLWRQESDK